ncbi:MAG: response regulator transcription factor [Bacteroidales bacterium]
MAKHLNIIVVETSYILYQGLLQLFSQSGFLFHSRQTGNMGETEKFIYKNPDSLVIINPSIIQHNLKEFQTLKNNWENVRWLALIYLYYEQHILSHFDGIISISDSPETISAVIHKVLTSENNKPSETYDNLLSDREIEVLQQLAMGLSNKEIADKLNISVNTVITHRKNISHKTGIKTVSGLTIYAVVHKFIVLDQINQPHQF